MKDTWQNILDNFRDIGRGVGSVFNPVGGGINNLAMSVRDLFTQPAKPYGSETPEKQAKAMADKVILSLLTFFLIIEKESKNRF